MRVLVGIEMRGGQARVQNAAHLRGQLIMDANALERDRLNELCDRGRERRRAHQHQMAADIERRILLGQPHGVVEGAAQSNPRPSAWSR